MLAMVELHVPGEDEPRRVVVDAASFDALATDTPMNELLITARPARPARRATKTTSGSASSTSTSGGTSGGGGGRVDYATLEHAGEPHKGKTTDLEKQLVRDHFDAINDRLSPRGCARSASRIPSTSSATGCRTWLASSCPGRRRCRSRS